MNEYRVEEFAQMIGESTTTVRQMIKDGELDVYRPIGKKYYLIRGLKDEKDDSQSLPEESNIAEYKVEEYAQMIGKSAMTVRRMINDGRLDAYRPIGKRYYLIRVKKGDKPQILPEKSNIAEYKVEEYAQMIGKSAITVRRMINDGRLDAYRPIGKRYYLIRGLKNEKDKPQILPEESNTATLSVMLDKINTLDKDTYRSIAKQIYLAYCQIVL